MEKKAIDHTLIVGDIHGCFDEWMTLLKKACYNSKTHRMILVGDLINKGEKSLKTLKWAYDHKIESVLGNHELNFIQMIEKHLPLPPSFEKLKNEMGSSLHQWIQYLKSWPTYIEEEDFLVVHGGLVPGQHPKESCIEDLVHLRQWNEKTKKRGHLDDGNSKPWHDYYTGAKLVVYGHWARQGFFEKKNSIGLDSGCVYGNKLTGIFLPSRTVIQVDSFQPRR